VIAVVGDAIIQFDFKTGKVSSAPIRGAHGTENVQVIAKSATGIYYATGSKLLIQILIFK